ncbi:7SK snRNA methylphosphate capping enzyme bin3-like [Lutzomyia longipalpis]|uniref:7SK snRNA methylphosphate capping enzyme bin3-like n=1 Tax=Lutzomyia longipalpis TaxID=7200 RepID=UPI0024836179|nr:7SK snRNA methylphosphate capping enzyme bin3-like [Lutzomyia longipalpis]
MTERVSTDNPPQEAAAAAVREQNPEDVLSPEVKTIGTQSTTSRKGGSRSKRKRQQANMMMWAFKRKKSGQANQENCQLSRKHYQKSSNFKNRRLQVFPTISKFFLPDKRPRKELIVPPTKFLLGGNISDPLNLNSLQNEAISASMNAATPKSSPMTTPPKVEVIIPPNIRDPLHLLDPVDSIEYEKQLISPMKRRSKHRNRKKKKPNKRDVAGGGDDAAGQPAAVQGARMGKEEPPAERPPEEQVSGDESKRAANERERAVRELKLDLSECGGRKRKTSEGPGSGNGKPKLRRMDSMDKIVSPVIPQPGTWKRPPRPIPTGPGRSRTRTHSQSTQADESELQSPLEENKEPSFKEEGGEVKAEVDAGKQDEQEEAPVVVKKPRFKGKDERFQYGNYDRYYGYRNLNEMMDVRLKVFSQHPFLFQKKDILDIGCNVGHLTIAVAKNLNPKSVMGIDIDPKLIERARKNLSLYVRIPQSPKAATETKPEDNDAKGHTEGKKEKEAGGEKRRVKWTKKRPKQENRGKKPEFFPSSFPLCYGSVPQIGAPDDAGAHDADASSKFPGNVFFRTLNYVLKDESLLGADAQQYDLIMCLSVTKWIHLNFGDAGLKIAFKRMFSQLRPGGKLILEAQNWASYKKKKRLTETIFNNYKAIEFFPNKFHEYLLSPEVGFSHSYALGVPRHLSKGFRRPIQLYVKGDFTPSQVRWSDAHHPQTPYTPYRGIYAEMMLPPPRLNSVYGPESTPYANCGSYSYRYTPSQSISSTSQYYNPLETDSYLPSYDSEVPGRRYCFVASPVYNGVWSPPASGRNSTSQTPIYSSGSNSMRECDGEEGYGSGRRHVYPPGMSTRSDECEGVSGDIQHVYAINEDGNSCDNSSSPQINNQPSDPENEESQPPFVTNQSPQ